MILLEKEPRPGVRATAGRARQACMSPPLRYWLPVTATSSSRVLLQ